MKKLLLFSACLMLAFSSCKKSDKNSTSTNTITANVGGSALTFNTAATALSTSDSNSGTYVLLITGATGTGSNAQAMQVAIDSQKPITKGTYTVSSSSSPDATAFPAITYVQSSSLTNPVSFSTVLDGTNVTTVTITSISSTNVQGTFSGVLVSDQDAVTTKSITNGNFNVAVTSHN